jgi:hypothetical protein
MMITHAAGANGSLVKNALQNQFEASVTLQPIGLAVGRADSGQVPSVLASGRRRSALMFTVSPRTSSASDATLRQFLGHSEPSELAPRARSGAA